MSSCKDGLTLSTDTAVAEKSQLYTKSPGSLGTRMLCHKSTLILLLALAVLTFLEALLKHVSMEDMLPKSIKAKAIENFSQIGHPQRTDISNAGLETKIRCSHIKGTRNFRLLSLHKR